MHISDNYKNHPNLAVSSVMDQPDLKGSVLNDISMYENSYNSRVIYSRKLYFVLLLQMILIGTFFEYILGSITCGAYSNDKFNAYLKKTTNIFWASLAICVATATFVLLFRRQSRSKPLNYILLLIFAVSAGLTSAYLVAVHDSIVGLLVLSSLASILKI